MTVDKRVAGSSEIFQYQRDGTLSTPPPTAGIVAGSGLIDNILPGGACIDTFTRTVAPSAPSPYEHWTWEAGEETVAHPYAGGPTQMFFQDVGLGGFGGAAGTSFCGNMGNVQFDSGSGQVIAVPGETYNFDGWMQGYGESFPVTGHGLVNMSWGVWWYNSGHVLLRADVIGSHANVPQDSAFVHDSASFVAPVGAAYFTLGQDADGALGGQTTHNKLDEVTITSGVSTSSCWGTSEICDLPWVCLHGTRTDLVDVAYVDGSVAHYGADGLASIPELVTGVGWWQSLPIEITFVMSCPGSFGYGLEIGLVDDVPGHLGFPFEWVYADIQPSSSRPLSLVMSDGVTSDAVSPFGLFDPDFGDAGLPLNVRWRIEDSLTSIKIWNVGTPEPPDLAAPGGGYMAILDNPAIHFTDKLPAIAGLLIPKFTTPNSDVQIDNLSISPCPCVGPSLSPVYGSGAYPQSTTG